MGIYKTCCRCLPVFTHQTWVTCSCVCSYFHSSYTILLSIMMFYSSWFQVGTHQNTFQAFDLFLYSQTQVITKTGMILLLRQHMYACILFSARNLVELVVIAAWALCFGLCLFHLCRFVVKSWISPIKRWLTSISYLHYPVACHCYKKYQQKICVSGFFRVF